MILIAEISGYRDTTVDASYHVLMRRASLFTHIFCMFFLQISFFILSGCPSMGAGTWVLLGTGMKKLALSLFSVTGNIGQSTPAAMDN